MRFCIVACLLSLFLECRHMQVYLKIDYIFRDDFNGSAGELPSSKDWKIIQGTSYPGGPPNWGMAEVQNYTNSPSNVALDGRGHLRITPLKDSSGQWTSGRIETVRDDFKVDPGKPITIEARIRLPRFVGDDALGTQPAFWMMGNSMRQDPNYGELAGQIEILKTANSDDRFWIGVDCGTPQTSMCFHPKRYEKKCPLYICRSRFRIFKIRLFEKNIAWYVNTILLHNFDFNQLGNDNSGLYAFNQKSFYIILNVAVGGYFANTVANRTTPTDTTKSGDAMLIDYIAVYSEKFVYS